ncbi:Cell division protein MraZ [Dissulfuribacter thermophilus]|uniref:Transcriptional regulator MraZ n=1 Tax=Dissulfuribacter thermophilus TaxID=1156395 RepID=A0A1B9F4J4_9BACT|nr:division/cell wall cluster transcriptional repressor MraZ [Dissulfuribacter thermophilus]OCC14744.1 Cell division protein MraZ [Dissulfuribacter thermophilus]
MFRGKSIHSLDAKGRLSIPARFKEVLKSKYSEKLFVTNQVKCLVAYPYEEWRKIEERFLGHPLPPPKIQQFQRYFVASAVECKLDSHGRILIPATLRDEVEIEKEVVLLGMLDHFEIWSRDKLEQELKIVKEQFDEYSSFVSDNTK